MRNLIFIFLITIMGQSFSIHAATEDTVQLFSPTKVNVSVYDITPDNFKKAALRAFLQRGWNVVSANQKSVVATIKGSYKAQIILTGQEVVIGYVTDNTREQWLNNLKRDLVLELKYFYFMKEANVNVANF